jgi:hypothetical protein
MGNNASVESGVAMAISLKGGTSVYAGDVLEGTISCELFKDIVDCDFIYLQFRGIESTIAMYERGTGKHKHVCYANDSYDIIQVNYIIHQCHNNIEKGQYEFPFSIHIPSSLSPSFSSAGAGCEAKLQYKLEAGLHRKVVAGWNWDVHNSVELSMYARNVPVPIIPASIEPETMRIKYMCCINKGNMYFGSKLSSTVVKQNEGIEINYAVYNNAAATVKAIAAVTTNTVQVEACRIRGSWQSTSVETRINKNELKHVTKIPNGGSADKNEINAVIKNELDSRVNKVALTIPANILPTYRGKLITVESCLRTSIRTPFCVDDPSIEIPLTIVGATKSSNEPVAVKNEKHFDLPVDWKAKRFDEITFSNSGIKKGKNDMKPTSAIFPPKTPVDPSINSLIDGLTSCVDEIPIVSEWVAYGNLSALTPDNFTEIFKHISNPCNYSIFAEILGKAMQESSCGGVTCAQIAGAMAAMPNTFMVSPYSSDYTLNVTIATAFHSSCKDKSNATTVFEPLFSAEFRSARCSLKQVLALYS